MPHPCPIHGQSITWAQAPLWGMISAMKELLRTNNPVRISWLTALLADAEIEAVVLDTHMSVLEGSASAIRRRLMVVNDDYPRARRILEGAGEISGASDG